ncbi:MAG: hypothetical protein ABJF10_28190 [Chthoniobacter sp.]|uniref:hypothetical protein n=1 Tax=Chthoniobacter sp. TaxID=2510640 RepID=UPI0032A6C6C4
MKHPGFLLAAICCAMLPLAFHAETWFQEAKRIRQEADATEARSKKFEILPDCELTEKSVKAGATFKDKGERVIVRRAVIHVELPVGREKGSVVYKYRDRKVNYNGEPAWTGRWREPWAMGSFTYTVRATYKGNVYVRQFKVGRNGVLTSSPK